MGEQMVQCLGTFVYTQKRQGLNHARTRDDLSTLLLVKRTFHFPTFTSNLLSPQTTRKQIQRTAINTELVKDIRRAKRKSNKLKGERLRIVEVDGG